MQRSPAQLPSRHGGNPAGLNILASIPCERDQSPKNECSQQAHLREDGVVDRAGARCVRGEHQCARYRASADRTPTVMKVSLRCRKPTSLNSRTRQTENGTGPVIRGQGRPTRRSGHEHPHDRFVRDIVPHARSRRLSGTTEPTGKAIEKMCTTLTQAKTRRELRLLAPVIPPEDCGPPNRLH